MAFRLALFPLSTLLFGLAACGEPASPPQKISAPVMVAVARVSDYAPTVMLTGEVRARRQTDLAFRTSGRISERLVDIGDHVSAGDVVARIDPREQQADLAITAAAVMAAKAQLENSQADFKRQKTLFGQGVTTRSVFEQSEEALRVAQGTLEAAEAQHAAAQDALTFAVLKAPMAGVITARYSESGQIVQTAQPILTLAEDGPRDAVFEVPEAALFDAPSDLTVDLVLIGNSRITAKGKVREISPAVDPRSGTVRVKIDIENPPETMTLGASVIGAALLRSRRSVVLPASVLSSDRGAPSVWIVHPDTNEVSRRSVAVFAYEAELVVLGAGVEAGELVVTGGARSLLPGQKVALIGTPAK